MCYPTKATHQSCPDVSNRQSLTLPWTSYECPRVGWVGFSLFRPYLANIILTQNVTTPEVKTGEKIKQEESLPPHSIHPFAFTMSWFQQKSVHFAYPPPFQPIISTRACFSLKMVSCLEIPVCKSAAFPPLLTWLDSYR